MTPTTRRLLVPGLFALVGVAILVGLGVWQLERREWKQALIARVAAAQSAPPVAAPGPETWPSLDTAALEYTPVTVTGRFHHDREVRVVTTLIEPKGPVSGVGFLVMTPLTTADGWMVYVNRGFVPWGKAAPPSRPAGLTEGEITVAGLFRAPHARSWFMPGDNAAGNEWFSRDPKLYAEASGLPPAGVAPYIVDAAFDPNLPGGLPQGGETIVDFPDNHLQYALTWFGLAAGLAGVFIAFARGRLRGGEAPPAG